MLQSRVKWTQRNFIALSGRRVITSTIGPIIDKNGDYIKDKEQISNITNTFFSSVFTAEDLTDIPTVPGVQINNNDILSSISITKWYVKIHQ